METIQVLGTERNDIWSRDLRMGKKKELEKIMIDYIRWIFNLDFCTPRYIVRRELDIEKLKIR